ncbi:MAG: hypothetical protein IPM69_07300 [Ignavibacteria bacterium]|nr:hypothetical protein [Ignavibacteria bacterium]
MKIVLLLFILCLSTATSQQPEWYRLDADLLHCTFVGNTSAYSLGTNGCLLRSVDKGASWRQIPTGVQTSLRGIAFADSLHGTVIGDLGTILVTTDGGISWKVHSFNSPYNLRAVSFKGKYGLIVGDNGQIIQSYDGGKTWQNIATSIKSSIFSVAFLSESTALIGDDFSRVYQSLDTGKTWTINDTLGKSLVNQPILGFSVFQDRIIAATRKNIFTATALGQPWKASYFPDGIVGFVFPKPKSGYVVKEFHSLYQSTDSGTTFMPFTTYDSTLLAWGANFTSVAFSDENTGIIVGSRKTIYRTTDGGKHWTLLSYLYQSEAAYSTQFISDDIGFFTSYGGNVYRTRDGGTTWLPQHRDPDETARTYSAVHFFDAQNGMVVFQNSKTIDRTTDGGATYSIKDSTKIRINYPIWDFASPTVVSLRSVIHYNNYSASLFYTSSDSGKTWREKRLDSVVLGIVFCFSKDRTYCSGYTQKNGINIPTFFRIINGGDSIERIPLPWFVQFPESIFFFDENKGFIGGTDTSNRQFILRTSNGGRTWEVADTTDYGEITNISALSFVDTLLGYAGGIFDLLIKTDDGGKTWKQSPIPKNPYPIAIHDIIPVNSDCIYAFGQLMEGKYDGIILKKLPPSFTSSVQESQIEVVERPSAVWLYAPRPVPTSGKIKLDAIWLMNLDVLTIRIKLYDMLGIELRDITDSFHSNAGTNTGIVDFDGSNLPTGIYYIEINGGGYRKAVPVIIAR